MTGTIEVPEAPIGFEDAERLLPAATVMGAPTLRVADLAAMTEYYSSAFAMEALEERADGPRVHRVLGRGAVPLMKLVAEPDLPLSGPHDAGLFHTAFVFETPEGLASTVLGAARHPATRFTGSADHAVSEAFYFTDPEGNGVELYTDRPRSAWRYDHGEVIVTTYPLDPNAFLRRHLAGDLPTAPTDRAGRVGHVHLQVGDIAPAATFYVEALGFAVTQRHYPSALFASAGGYHHHIAVNTWRSQGAGPRAATLGLGELAVQVPDRAALDAVAARLRSLRIPYADDGETLAADDPWGTHVAVRATATTTENLLAR